MEGCFLPGGIKIPGLEIPLRKQYLIDRKDKLLEKLGNERDPTRCRELKRQIADVNRLIREYNRRR